MTSAIFAGTAHIQGEETIQSMYPRGQELWGHLRILTTTHINDDSNGIFVNTCLVLHTGFPFWVSHSQLPPGICLWMTRISCMFAFVLWTLFEMTQIAKKNGKMEKSSENLMVRKTSDKAICVLNSISSSVYHQWVLYSNW